MDSFKRSTEHKIEKFHKRTDWLKFAFGACLFFGFGNFLTSTLGSKYGPVGVFSQGMGQLFCWAVYHASVNTGTFYFDKNFCTRRIIGIILRGLNHIGAILLLVTSFYFGSLAHVNQGVIAGLFTSGVVFTAILFYFVYNEKVSSKNFIGMGLVITGVLCVTVKDDSNELINYQMLLIAVFFAMLTGMSFATGALIVKHCCKNYGFNPFQLTVDGNAVSAVPMIIGYIVVQTSDTPISIVDSALGVSISFLYVSGSICFAHAFTSGGLGGPIQSIDSLKSLVPLFLHGLISGVMPTVPQWIGVGLGILGAFVIGM